MQSFLYATYLDEFRPMIDNFLPNDGRNVSDNQRYTNTRRGASVRSTLEENVNKIFNICKTCGKKIAGNWLSNLRKHFIDKHYTFNWNKTSAKIWIQCHQKTMQDSNGIVI